jgi:Asp-tRNA(Asn)/Glu-tRNA(Gln) amidotransferase A subunit family amidase
VKACVRSTKALTHTPPGTCSPPVTCPVFSWLPPLLHMTDFTDKTANAIPIRQSPGGLPVGAQIIGNTFADPLFLNMVRRLETEGCGFVPPPYLA